MWLCIAVLSPFQISAKDFLFKWPLEVLSVVRNRLYLMPKPSLYLKRGEARLNKLKNISPLTINNHFKFQAQAALQMRIRLLRCGAL